MGGPYGGIVELLVLAGQHREEVGRLIWKELDLGRRVWTIPKSRTKNAKEHIAHLSEQSLAVLKRSDRQGLSVFSLSGTKPFQGFSKAKRQLDEISGVSGWRLHDLRRTCVSGMARLSSSDHQYRDCGDDDESVCGRACCRRPRTFRHLKRKPIGR
jgi:integrase